MAVAVTGLRANTTTTARIQIPANERNCPAESAAPRTDWRRAIVPLAGVGLFSESRVEQENNSLSTHPGTFHNTVHAVGRASMFPEPLHRVLVCLIVATPPALRETPAHPRQATSPTLLRLRLRSTTQSDPRLSTAPSRSRRFSASNGGLSDPCAPLRRDERRTRPSSGPSSSPPMHCVRMRARLGQRTMAGAHSTTCDVSGASSRSRWRLVSSTTTPTGPSGLPLGCSSAGPS